MAPEVILVAECRSTPGPLPLFVISEELGKICGEYVVVKIEGKRRKKTITLSYEDNEDLDEILALLCGKDFLNEV